MEYRYTPNGVCSSEFIIEIEGNKIKSLKTNHNKKTKICSYFY